MSNPLYADRWYQTPSVDQLRQEIQNVYEQLIQIVSSDRAPTTSDNESEGYSLGDRWYDTTTETEYVCVTSSLTSATWKQTTP